MKKILIKQLNNKRVFEKFNTTMSAILMGKSREEQVLIYHQLKNLGYKVVAECNSKLPEMEILEECFKYFNIQNDDTRLNNIEYTCIDDNGKYNMHSLSIGDVVQIENSHYLCVSNGWACVCKCEYCENGEPLLLTADCNSIYIDKNNNGEMCIVNSDSYDGNMTKIKYCPMCGNSQIQ